MKVLLEKSSKKLKEILDTSIKNLNEREKNCRQRKKKLSIKKIISAEEYKKSHRTKKK